MQPDAEKVLIYATSGARLLVFDEPAFPEVELQVPGGTVEANEAIAVAARREFFEETGLEGGDFIALGVDDYRFCTEDRSIYHRRHYFHVELSGPLPETWLHSEDTPNSGGPPIVFRLFWIGIAEAASRLGYGMGNQLFRLGHLSDPAS